MHECSTRYTSVAGAQSIQTVGHFYSAENAHAHYFLPRGVCKKGAKRSRSQGDKLT